MSLVSLKGCQKRCDELKIPYEDGDNTTKLRAKIYSKEKKIRLASEQEKGSSKTANSKKQDQSKASPASTKKSAEPKKSSEPIKNVESKKVTAKDVQKTSPPPKHEAESPTEPEKPASVDPPEVDSQDELKTHIPVPEDNIKDMADSTEKTIPVEPVPIDNDYDPFSDPVVERAYTSGNNTSASSSDASPSPTDPDLGVGDANASAGVPPDAEAIPPPQDIPPPEDIPEPSYTEHPHDIPDSDPMDSPSDEHGDPVTKKEEDDEGASSMSDMSPTQKRKAAEKTADAIMLHYCNYAPAPFKKWASFSERKIRQLQFTGKIDLTQVIAGANGEKITIGEHIEGTNKQVEEIFTVSEETKDDIREPLIEVLLENEVMLTPSQRLMMAITGHILEMTASAYMLSQQNKTILEMFIQSKADDDRRNAAPAKEETQEYNQAPLEESVPVHVEAPSAAAQEMADKLERELESEITDDDVANALDDDTDEN